MFAALAKETWERFDPAAPLGLVLLVVLVGAAMVAGGSPAAFADPAAALIVFGGTFAGTMMSLPWRQLAEAPRTLLAAFSIKASAPTRLVAAQCLEAAARAARLGSHWAGT